MKKVSLLIGTLGGAMAGYLFSNKKLRDELQGAKDPEDAAQYLAKHLQKDGKKLATEMQKFIESEEFQSNVDKAKKYALDKGDQAKKELQKAVAGGKKTAKKSAKKAVRKGASKIKKAKRTVKKTTAKAKKTAKRVKTKTRKVS